MDIIIQGYRPKSKKTIYGFFRPNYMRGQFAVVRGSITHIPTGYGLLPPLGDAVTVDNYISALRCADEQMVDAASAAGEDRMGMRTLKRFADHVQWLAQYYSTLK